MVSIHRNKVAIARCRTAARLCAVLLTTTAVAYADPSNRPVDDQPIAHVLDSFHRAAAEGDWPTYFDLMSDDAVFIGTDAAERWTKPQFQAYAGTRSGWAYTVKSRNINLMPSGAGAWFDEILSHDRYGTCRGSGVLIRTETGWKISQYHLTFPIPNALAARMTEEIRQYEQQQAR